MGMMVAYSGTRPDTSRKAALAATLSFMLGVVLFLIALGAVAGFVGQSAQTIFGKYWKIFAGAMAIVMGLASLKMLPFKRPQWSQTARNRGHQGLLSMVLIGLLIGGGLAASSLPCNPGIFIVLGATILQGRILWGMALMTAFALGYSLPLGAILFGISYGKAALQFQKAEAVIRTPSRAHCWSARAFTCWRHFNFIFI